MVKCCKGLASHAGDSKMHKIIVSQHAAETGYNVKADNCGR